MTVSNHSGIFINKEFLMEKVLFVCIHNPDSSLVLLQSENGLSHTILNDGLHI
jgi:hypothetical protein